MLSTSPKALPTTSKQKLETHVARVYTYNIKKTRLSDSALVFFARRLDTQQRVVIKILCDYEDTRYSLTDPQKRLACQIEALHWNQKFTPGIYLGLGRLVEPDLKILEQISKKGRLHNIIIEDFVVDIQKLSEFTSPNANYALIMECLPKERRLDYLLRQKKTGSIKHILGTLIKRVVEMHELSPSLDNFPSDENGKVWGSYEQLQGKLRHNIDLFNNLALLDDQSFYETYCWLKEDLNEIIKDPRFFYYFNERLTQKHIKRCHGDLKARNIWIEREEHSTDVVHQVRILDAIDFNPSYCNIDVLSDIAMLAIDTQAVDMQLHQHDDLKDRGQHLAEFITSTYLTLTMQQNDQTAKIVLTYYLLEKALVRASISLFYDRNEHPQLGTFFLKIATEYMTQLKKLLYPTSFNQVDNLVMTARRHS